MASEAERRRGKSADASPSQQSPQARGPQPSPQRLPPPARPFKWVYLWIGAAFVITYSAMYLKIERSSQTDDFMAGDVTKASVPSGPRLIAVGDLHGDFQQTLEILKLVGVADPNGAWIGGDAVLVQTGDLLDRGPNSVEVVQLFEKLKADAPQQGGRVVTLLGNHELMNLQGALYYVSPIELERLGAFDRAQQLSDSQFPKLTSQPWFRMLRTLDQKKGAMMWWSLLEPGEVLGDAVRGLPVAQVLGEGPCRTLFVHAGLTIQMLQPFNISTGQQGPPSAPEDILALMNAQVYAALMGCPGEGCGIEKLGSLLGPDGIVWYRGYDRLPESALCSKLAALLMAVGAERVVAGHNIQKHIKTRCHGRLHMIDVGMSRAYFGRLAGWECSEGRTYAMYSGGVDRVELP
eukprot:evm.model.scf_1653.2 EVM.evm.TU.scf_1653.2   scf_1653:11234-17196(-)